MNTFLKTIGGILVAVITALIIWFLTHDGGLLNPKTPTETYHPSDPTHQVKTPDPTNPIDIPVPQIFPDPQKKYSLRNLASNKYLEVQGGTSDLLARVSQSSYTANSNQLWKFEALSGADAGYYGVHPAHNLALCLEVEHSSTDNQGIIGQYTWFSTDNQKWKLELVSSSKENYFIIAKHSGKVIDLYGSNPAEHAEVSQYQKEGGKNQQWRIEEEQ